MYPALAGRNRIRLLLAGWRQILQHLQATQMPDGGYVCFSVPAPGHGGPHRHGQRYTKIEDHLAPIVKPLRDSAIKRAEHDPQQLRQPCTFAAKCRAVIPPRRLPACVDLGGLLQDLRRSPGKVTRPTRCAPAGAKPTAGAKGDSDDSVAVSLL